MNSPNIIEHRLLASLQKLEENILSQNVLTRLFAHLGYHADFYGGKYEKGRDIILRKRNEFDIDEVTVVQVKRIKSSASSSSKSSLAGLINQLGQASETPVPQIDGAMRLPDKVLLVTPYPIDTRSLESAFDGLQARRVWQRIMLIDGTKLAKLLLNHDLPLVTELLGAQTVLESTTIPQLSNTTLLEAIGGRFEKQIKHLYCHLEFSLGRTRSEFFFALPAATDDAINIDFKERDLKQVLDVQRLISQEFGVDVLDIREDDIERQRVNFASERTRRIASEYGLVPPQSPQPSSTEGGPYASTLFLWGSKASINGTQFSNIYQAALAPCLEAFTNLDLGSLRLHSSDVECYLSRIAHICFHVVHIYRGITCVLTAPGHKPRRDAAGFAVSTGRGFKLKKRATCAAEFEVFSSGCEELAHTPLAKFRAAFSRATKVFEAQTDVVFHVSYQTSLMLHALMQKRHWLEARIAAINSDPIQVSTLQSFLRETHRLFACLEALGQLPQLVTPLISTSPEDRREPLVLTVPLPTLFDTGASFAVFGEAGAGKTTTLMAYSQERQARRGAHITIFIALAHLTRLKRQRSSQSHRSKTELGPVPPKERASDLLMDLIDAHYADAGHSVDIRALLQSGAGVTVLLDGVDEFIEVMPEIPSAVRELSEKYPKVQFLLSSRLSGAFVRDVPFHAVTIRPFTKKQRDEFVRAWFIGGLESKPDEVLKHLDRHPAVGEVIRNPLLATVLCVLAENDIPLPDREVRLYQERTELLVGRYDRAKGIQRVHSDPEFLKTVARQLAFYLHKNHLTSDTPEALRRIARQRNSARYSRHVIVRAVNELFDPCNLLVSMTAEGRWGFGHLRFQEFLVAEELQRNRNIDLGKLLTSQWWRGPLYLYAQSAEELDFLFKEAYRQDTGAALRTVEEMLKFSPQTEIDRLDSIIDRDESPYYSAELGESHAFEDEFGPEDHGADDE